MSVLHFFRVFTVFLFLTLVRRGYFIDKRILLTDPQYAHQFEAKLQTLTKNNLELSSKFNDLSSKFSNLSSKFNDQSTQLMEQQHKSSIQTTQLMEQQYRISNQSAKLVEQQHNISTQQQRISELDNSMTMLQQRAKPGGLYVRWGRKSCPLINDTEMVYTGFAGGSYYSHSGAAANHLCMPHDPQYVLPNTEAAGAFVYGTEYESNFYSNVYDNDVPCAVCKTRRSTVLMLPARQDCYAGWTKEYTGVLSAGRNEHHATEYVCLDRHPTTLEHSDANEDGAVFYLVSSKCGSLPCPPYKDNGILSCVVCTK